MGVGEQVGGVGGWEVLQECQKHLQGAEQTEAGYTAQASSRVCASRKSMVCISWYAIARSAIGMGACAPNIIIVTE